MLRTGGWKAGSNLQLSRPSSYGLFVALKTKQEHQSDIAALKVS